MMRKKLKCSLTVEASLVMVIILLAIGSLIIVSMSLYDKVLMRSVLIETMELYSHKYDDTDYMGNEARLQNCMMSSDGRIVIEENKITKKIDGQATINDDSFEYTRSGMRTEQLMRAVTLIKIAEDL